MSQSLSILLENAEEAEDGLMQSLDGVGRGLAASLMTTVSDTCWTPMEQLSCGGNHWLLQLLFGVLPT